jgi:chorismate mutase / prephenate dehydratase
MKQKTTDASQIPSLREAIDAIDDRILDLVNRRLELALEIGRAKAQKGGQVLDKAREINILKRLTDLNAGPIDDPALEAIFRAIMASSRALQTARRVSYLGPEATFTHIAALKHFGRGVSLIPQPSIRDVFLDVEKGACHYGVVPVENSIEGAVNHTLDLFFESDLKICAECYQPISHDLLAADGSLKDIRTVYSHPQAFAQCRRWLGKYLPDAEPRECGSTAYAAKLALSEPGAAAIASSEAAHIYALQVVASRIEDVARNTTRFLVIGPDEAPATGDDKTSIMFVTSHIPGALYRVLQPMAEAGVNMMKLESRPTKHENWSYFFFVDVEGHVSDPAVARTLSGMEPICLYLKCLGSYPRDKNV